MTITMEREDYPRLTQSGVMTVGKSLLCAVGSGKWED